MKIKSLTMTKGLISLKYLVIFKCNALSEEDLASILSEE